MSESVHVELPDNLTIAKIHPFHEALESIIDDSASDEFVMDANSVARTDTAGIQILYAFVLAAKERQIKVTWKDPSETLTAAVSILGMSEALGIH